MHVCVCMLIHVHQADSEVKQLQKQNCISAQSYNVHANKTIKKFNMYSNIYVHIIEAYNSIFQ